MPVPATLFFCFSGNSEVRYSLASIAYNLPAIKTWAVRAPVSGDTGVAIYYPHVSKGLIFFLKKAKAHGREVNRRMLSQIGKDVLAQRADTVGQTHLV